MADLAPIKTDWFDGSVKPVNVGVYERQWPEGVLLHKWDGAVWFAGQSTAEEAESCRVESLDSRRPWRGVVPEVHGCVPVHAPNSKGCQRCAFDGPAVIPNTQCASAIRAVGSCAAQEIIWRPRSEVSA